MKAIQIIVEGNWGHFKRPETNNNPLTHDFITKTALIGMIGAVLGYERAEMKDLFPQLSDSPSAMDNPSSTSPKVYPSVQCKVLHVKQVPPAHEQFLNLKKYWPST